MMGVTGIFNKISQAVSPILNSLLASPATTTANQTTNAQGSAQAINRMLQRAADQAAPADYAVVIALPPGKDSISEWGLKARIVKEVFEHHGVAASRAAIEETAAKVHFTDFTGTRTASGGLRPNLADGRLPTAQMYKTADGREVRGYKLTLYKETQMRILEHRAAAESLTASGARGVSQMTAFERMQTAAMVAWERGYYGKELTAAMSGLSREQIGLVIALGMAGGVASQTAARGALGQVGLGLAVNEAMFKGVEFLDFYHSLAAAHSQADIDKSAHKLAGFVGRLGTDAFLGVMAAGGAGLGRAGMTGVGQLPPHTMMTLKAEFNRQVGAMADGLEGETLAVDGFGGVRARELPTSRADDLYIETRGRGTGGGAAFEQKVRTTRSELAAERFEKVIEGDKLTQAARVTNRPAADHIGFVKTKGGYRVEISEITTGDKPLTHLIKQLDGAMKVAQGDRELGHQANQFEFRVFTDNEKLVKALKAENNRLKIGGGDPRTIEVIFVGGKK